MARFIILSCLIASAFAGVDQMMQGMTQLVTQTSQDTDCPDSEKDSEGNCKSIEKDLYDKLEREFNTGGSGSLANSIASLNEYGCWCYFDDDHGRGKGSPIDVVDEQCKVLHDGYECAMRDAEDEGTTCVPWEVHYESGLGGSQLLVNEQCAKDNPGNNCAIRACIIEGTFVAALLDIFVSGGIIEQNHRHRNGFDPAVECIVKKSGGGPVNKQCCGEYPDRFPFKTVGGDRKCCGNRTYNSLTLKCCDHNSSTVKFNC